MKTWTIVVAGGAGLRFGARKQFALLAHKPVVTWSLEAAREASGGVVLVVPRDAVGDAGGWGADHTVAGGETRAASVRAGLSAVPDDVEMIAVHDGARPLATPDLYTAVFAAVEAGADGALPGVAVTDTIRLRSGGVIDRSELVAVQTPQAFRADILRRAHALGAEATDDATLVEAIGGRIVVVDGDPTNIKITDRHDLTVAERLLTA